MAGVVIASSPPVAEGILADLIIEIIEDMRADRLTEDVQAVRQDTQQEDTLDHPELVVPRQRAAAHPMPHQRAVVRLMPQQHAVAADHMPTPTNNR
jgi:hypothetical protein